MRDPLTAADLRHVSAGLRTSAQRWDAVARLVDWAAAPHPEDHPHADPASLLLQAAVLLDEDGDPDAALALSQRAVEVWAAPARDPRPFLHRRLIKTGRTDEAAALDAEVAASRPDEPEVYDLMAANHEHSGDLAAAIGWLERGIRRCGTGGLDGAGANFFLVYALYFQRAALRKRLGLPPDDADRSTR